MVKNDVVMAAGDASVCEWWLKMRKDIRIIIECFYRVCLRRVNVTE